MKRRVSEAVKWAKTIMSYVAVASSCRFASVQLWCVAQDQMCRRISIHGVVFTQSVEPRSVRIESQGWDTKRTPGRMRCGRSSDRNWSRVLMSARSGSNVPQLDTRVLLACCKEQMLKALGEKLQCGNRHIAYSSSRLATRGCVSGSSSSLLCLLCRPSMRVVYAVYCTALPWRVGVTKGQARTWLIILHYLRYRTFAAEIPYLDAAISRRGGQNISVCASGLKSYLLERGSVIVKNSLGPLSHHVNDTSGLVSRSSC